jgi:flagellar M-ring protein FliF
MPEAMTSAFRRLTHSIREFTVAQRTIAIIGVAVLVIAIIALSAWLSKPTMSPLYSGLSGADANALVTQLQTDGVQYQLTDGGATILVPDASVNPERIKAAAAGLPSLKEGGYALLDKMPATAGEQQMDTTYKRALEGELASTIESMDGVQTASVKLAIPEQTVFTSEQQAPTASVFIEPSGGATFTSDQVQAITHLTAASVPDMKSKDVSVISSDGTVLSASGTDTVGSTDKSTSAYEERTRTAVQAMLDSVVGAGNATVVVAADVSSESAKRVQESFTTPTNAPVLNESAKTETYGDGTSGTGATGVLGPDNIAVPSGTSTSGTGGYISSDVTKNNAIDKVTETRTIPAGAISKQSVSVAVNSAKVKGISATAITNLVNSAAGIDSTRGDTVAVEMVAFPKGTANAASKALQAAKDAEGAANLNKIITTSITALGVLLALMIIVFAIARFSRRKETTPIDLGELSATSLLAPTPAPEFTPVVPKPILPTPAAPALAAGELPEPGDMDRMRADIDALAEANPQRTAEYLRNFMDERQNA